MLRRIIVPIVIVLMLPLIVSAQNEEVKADTTSKVGRVPSKPKPYKDVITEKTTTDPGLLTIHKLDEKYYFEIPDSLLDRDILTINRIVKSAAGDRPYSGFLGYAGDLINSNVIRFSRGPNNRLFIKRISYSERSADSTENGMYRSLSNSNLQPLIASFDIKAYSPDSTASVIDITNLITGDNDILFFHPAMKKTTFKLGAFQGDKSYVSKVSSYPENVEIAAVKTYGVDGDFKTYELNSSIVLLPKTPMQPRRWDKRVGYFATQYTDFDANPNRVEMSYMITRWRLEPKDHEIEKYKRGELVEPKKPIIFYIDPATPKKWVPYLIQGVNDWQTAFEKAGFKNAIFALEAPAEDTTWSLEDARHSAIIYKPSAVPNAYGPHIHDPRSGEILEAKVGWFHNVMQVLHSWYMLQAGPIDPGARTMALNDSLMGQLIRFVSSHEIGHTLGLQHNFGSSSTIPTDSLRNKRWVEANGHTPSIMDYARFNYVAQPEDSLSRAGIFPRIGVYDKWAVEWGYRWLPQFANSDNERAFFNEWIIKSLKSDKKLWFAYDRSRYRDPRRQSEDLGDDLVKSSTYGIRNLKRVVQELPKWTAAPTKDYRDLYTMYSQLIDQYTRYIYHVVPYIGAQMYTAKAIEQQGGEFEFVPKGKQKEALRFLFEQGLVEPKWLVDQPYIVSSGIAATLVTDALREQLLYTITSNFTLFSLNKWEGLRPSEAYTAKELLADLYKYVFRDLMKNQLSIAERHLQKLYLRRLIELAKRELPHLANAVEAALQGQNHYNNVPSIAKGILKTIEVDVINRLKLKSDESTKLHFQDLIERLQDYKNKKDVVNQSNSAADNTLQLNLDNLLQAYLKSISEQDSPCLFKGCTMWHLK